MFDWECFMKKTIILGSLITSLLLLAACAAPEAYKPSGTGGLWGRSLGFKEEKIAHNKWFLSFHTRYDTSDAGALKLLYRRANEFGNHHCPRGFITEKPDVKDDDIVVTATTILTCKDNKN